MNKIYGYVRVSSKSQIGNNSIENQIAEIMSKYSKCYIYEEQFTGKTTDRPRLKELLSNIDAGDILVVSKLDRLARNLREGIEVIEELFAKGVTIDILNIGIVENTMMGRFFVQTLLAVSEMEREMILERTREGKEIAKLKPGFRDGRPKKFTKDVMDAALDQLTINGGTMSYKEVERRWNISKSTLIRENNRRKSTLIIENKTKNS